MADVSLKTDFKDGEKLFGQQLNNNFGVIKAALNTLNKIVWQDDPDDSVTAFRGTTEEINSRDVIDGQILYNTETGETYIDYGSQRISTGSGNAIHIGDEQPTNPATLLWVDPNEPLQLIGTEVVNSMEGTEYDKAPSVQSVKNYISSRMQILWTNPDPTQEISETTDISLSSSDYDMIEIYYIQATNSTALMYSNKILKGASTRMRISTTDGANIYRGMTYLSDTSYRIDLPYNDVSLSNINSLVIPVYIIGYKNGNVISGGDD